MSVVDVRLDDLERRIRAVEDQTRILTEMSVQIAKIQANLKNLTGILAAIGTLGGGSVVGVLHHLLTR